MAERKPGTKGVRVEIRVELKPGVMDAEASAVKKALGLLGIDGLGDVGTARVYTLEFPGAKPADAEKRAQAAVEKLLANPVIHRVEMKTLAGA